MTKTALDKTFDPKAIEAKWYAHWEANGLFRPARPDARPFTIVNPPPNVTGSLHVGHALDNTLQDIVVRHERLRGKDALWVVGTDHAGIATQMVVERQLEEAQDKRSNYSRDEFVAKVWEWKAESGGTITQQLRRLGCSMDWSREQFTMDPHFTKAVVKVFVDLHREGLIYRDKRLVNWDPKLKTAISDLEVETRETKGSFWRFSYPFADGSGALEVATTRPETMLADMCVAVNPADARYQAVVGKDILQPITGRLFKVLADEHADPELGSGVVKITPGHDFNDFEVGKRAGFAPGDMLNMFDAEAKVVQTSDGLVPAEFLGLDRFVARKLVVERMKELGFLIPHLDKDGAEHDAEPRTIQTPFGDRGGVEIEPWLTDQWYVNAAELAKAPMVAVRDGRIEIVPKTWEKTWFNWMENIQPWCVSRQLWWGHRIPAWYGSDGECYVAETEEAAQAKAGPRITLKRDEDVLDTWFSSALWPFATLGWPEQSELLERHYPNDLLISGFDILFFWCARMAMLGTHFNQGQVPWKRLYLHGLVRAADGQKMSKSKGNVVDPLVLIDQYGADALRFFMASMESQGRDVKMDERRVEGYRNFATKLWNAARFCQSNGIGASEHLAAPKATTAVNQWIVGEVVETVAALDQAMADLRFDAAANTIYHFVWDQFCDWYIELIKPALSIAPALTVTPAQAGAQPDQEDGRAAESPVTGLGPGLRRDDEESEETRKVAGWVLDQILVMLHPFMPFVTEELWSNLGERADYPLITAKWPEPRTVVDAEAKAEIELVIKVIDQIRSQRLEVGFKASDVIPISILSASDTDLVVVNRNVASISRIARIQPALIEITTLAGTSSWGFEIQPKFLVNEVATTSFVSAQFPIGEITFLAFTQGFVDTVAEKARLTKALELSTKEAKSLEGRLSNPAFVEKAKPEAVEKARADHALHAAEAERLAAALARLG